MIVKKAFAITFETIEGIGGFQVAEENPGNTLERFFTNFLGALTVIGGIMFLVYFVLGAMAWITSRGEREQVAKAQRYMTNALIGIIFLVLAWALVGVIGRILGFSIMNLSENIGTYLKGP